MAAQVNLEGARTHETLVTLFALKRSLPSVPSIVVRQVPVGRERASAVFIVAQEGLLPVVDPLVRFQITSLRKALATAREVTNEGFLSNLNRY